MKRWFILLLALCLCLEATCGLAESKSDALAQLTAQVKGKLGIEDDYAEFYSDYYESAGKKFWNLYWNAETGSLSVTCDEDGTIYAYNRYDATERFEYSSYYAPALPSANRADCLPAAEAFLASVIDEPNTSWTIEAGEESLSDGKTTQYSYRGNLIVNGYKTQIVLYVNVRIADRVVTDFHRSDFDVRHTSFVMPETFSDAADARAALDAGYSMALHYVMENGKAVLRYLPVWEGPEYIDAQTGEPLETDEQYLDSMTASEKPSAAGGEDTEASVDYGLTGVELTGIAEMASLLTQEQMDRIVRSYDEFGIAEEWSLTDVHVIRYAEDDIRATLSYAREVTRSEWLGTDEDAGEEETDRISKTVIIDARTGELISLYTNYPYFYGESARKANDMDTMQQAADAFLARYYSDIAADMRLTNSTFNEEDKSTYPKAMFRYTREVNGALFDACNIALGINVYTGLVDSFSRQWLDDVEFEPAENLIGEEEALKNYLAQFEEELIWVSVPVEVVDYNYTYKGVLCYQIAPKVQISAVDAHTGACIEDEYTGSTTFTYSDIQDSPYREQIENLGNYGVGFAGGKLLPEQALTGREALTLLLQAGGFGNMESRTWEDMLTTAKNRGIVEDLQENEEITRAWLAKTLIAMSGYGKVAIYTDIFVCSFADASQIKPEDYGYIAIAQGMGIAIGDENGCFRPEDKCTRAEALQMLYAFLTR